jgi:hypothetical protein
MPPKNVRRRRSDNHSVTSSYVSQTFYEQHLDHNGQLQHYDGYEVVWDDDNKIMVDRGQRNNPYLPYETERYVISKQETPRIKAPNKKRRE